MTRRLPPIQSVFDSHGHLIGAKDSQVDSYGYGGFSNTDSEAQNEFKNFNDGVSSTMKWVTIASVGKLVEVFESSCIYVLLLLTVSVVASKSNQKKVCCFMFIFIQFQSLNYVSAFIFFVFFLKRSTVSSGNVSWHLESKLHKEGIKPFSTIL